jgi:hypothetical protein
LFDPLVPTPPSVSPFSVIPPLPDPELPPDESELLPQAAIQIRALTEMALRIARMFVLARH